VRILLLNLYYPPDTSATAKMAQTVVEAVSAAHDVTVVCGRPSYEPTERGPGACGRRKNRAGRLAAQCENNTRRLDGLFALADETTRAELFDLCGV